MIILHEPKIIFLKSRKVAGTSFEIALSKFANKSSIITPINNKDELLRSELGFLGPRNYKESWCDIFNRGFFPLLNAIASRKRPVKFFNHIGAAEVRQKVGDKTWGDYKKISIIRNPFDYAVSSYFHAQKVGTAKGVSFDDYCINNSNVFNINNMQYKIDGKNIIDFYLRYETIIEDIKQLELIEPSLSGLSEVFSSIKAKGSYRPKTATTQEMFAGSKKALELIKLLCYEDIENFGFDVPN